MHHYISVRKRARHPSLQYRTKGCLARFFALKGWFWVICERNVAKVLVRCDVLSIKGFCETYSVTNRVIGRFGVRVFRGLS